MTKHLESLLRFHHKESNSFKELSWHKEEHEAEFWKMLNDLKSKKDRLWNSWDKLNGDYTSWNLKEEDIDTMSQWIDNEVEAKRRMLTFESF